MSDPSSPSARRPLPRLAAIAIVALAFAIPAAVLIALQVNHGPRFDDQQEYHLPTIWQIASTWPHVDANALPAAMTPGYHLLMAAVARAGGGVVLMQALTALITCGFLAMLACAASRHNGGTASIFLCLPVVFSPYIFTSGIYVTPHNLAWCGVLAVLLLSLRSRQGAGTIVAFGVIFAALVFVMQSQAWAIAPMLVGAGLSSTTLSAKLQPSDANRFEIRETVAVLLAALPAALLLAWFVVQWGGLAPHKQEWVQSTGYVNFAAIAMVLAVVGAIGAFYLPSFWTTATKPWAAIGAAFGFLVSLIPQTTYDKPAGRWGGLWNIAAKLPAIAERSPVIVLLGAIGGCVIGAMLAAQGRRDRWTFAAALAGFIAAHAMINQSWQRYYEPMILITLVLAASRSRTMMGAAQQRLSRILLATITVVQIGLTVMSLRG